MFLYNRVQSAHFVSDSRSGKFIGKRGGLDLRSPFLSVGAVQAVRLYLHSMASTLPLPDQTCIAFLPGRVPHDPVPRDPRGPVGVVDHLVISAECLRRLLQPSMCHPVTRISLSGMGGIEPVIVMTVAALPRFSSCPRRTLYRRTGHLAAVCHPALDRAKEKRGRNRVEEL